MIWEPLPSSLPFVWRNILFGGKLHIYTRGKERMKMKRLRYATSGLYSWITYWNTVGGNPPLQLLARTHRLARGGGGRERAVGGGRQTSLFPSYRISYVCLLHLHKVYELTLLLVFFLCRRGDFIQNSRWRRVHSISGSCGSLLRRREILIVRLSH